MKKIILYCIIIVIVNFFSSCEKFKLGGDFLSNPPDMTSINKDTIFSDIKYAERFLWSAYATLPWGIKNNSCRDYLESLTDLVQSPPVGVGVGNVLYYDGLQTAETENASNGCKFNFYTSGGWNGIRICLIFIDNIDRVPNTDEAHKKLLKAEARAIIATHYSIMYRHYGGLTWINKDLPVTTLGQFPRLTSIATLDSIVALIDKAIPDLPWCIYDMTNWEGRFTKAGLMGLKARILLFAASPLFNDDSPYMDGEAAQQKLVWHGSYDPNLWIKARDAAGELIAKVESEGGYRIYSSGNPRKDFQNAYFTRGYGETLISTRTVFKADVSDYYGIVWYNGAADPTQEYVDMFPMANGKPITDPSSGYDPNNPYANRDPRLYETILVNGDIYRGRTAELWIGGRERLSAGDQPTFNGYGPRKFILDGDVATLAGAIEQWPLLRLAEIYLSYAEAINEVNNGPNTEAYRCVNIIRNRVGLGNLPTGLSKVDFRECILNERACEFGMEEVRWFDIIRWKKVDVFAKQLHGMNITKVGASLTYQKFPLKVRNWSIHWNPRWYLSAFPQKEILKNYGLIQNPGWEM